MNSLWDKDTTSTLPSASRNIDPATSHLAEAQITAEGIRGHMMQTALALVRNSPGLTANEYEKQHGFENGQLRKRLNDLWRAGMIQKGQDRLCSVSKRRAQTWLV